jgi:S-adenosylmethionine/arginine decarboxylase-like enzyme
MKKKIYATKKQREENKFLALNILNNNSKISFIPHLTLYTIFTGIDPFKLQNKNFLTSLILSSIFQARMKLIKFMLHKFKGGGGGVTAVALIGDSHIIVNTFPETTSLLLDIYACSGHPINIIYEFVRQLKPKRIEFVILPRNLKDENVESRIIISEKDVKDKKLKIWMKERNLLPLVNTTEKFLILVNLIGFIFGDGYLHKNLNYMAIWQKNRYVLEILQEKLKRLKVKAKIKEKLSKTNKKVFELFVNDRNLSKLLFLLGTPKGSKIEQKLKLPWWLKEDEHPINAMFLSSFLFSELSKPKAKYMFTKQTLTPYIILSMMTKRKNEKDLVEFFINIKKLLLNFHIQINKISRKKIGEKIKLKLQIKATKQNLLRIQALLSLTKIFPIGIFDVHLPLVPSTPLYNKKSAFYKIIDYLIKHKESYGMKMFRKINISQQNGYKWIHLLNHSGIIKRKKRGNKVIIGLNI